MDANSELYALPGPGSHCGVGLKPSLLTLAKAKTFIAATKAMNIASPPKMSLQIQYDVENNTEISSGAECQGGLGMQW